jgi:hypothetical protein
MNSLTVSWQCHIHCLILIKWRYCASFMNDLLCVLMWRSRATLVPNSSVLFPCITYLPPLGENLLVFSKYRYNMFYSSFRCLLVHLVLKTWSWRSLGFFRRSGHLHYKSPCCNILPFSLPWVVVQRSFN